MVDGCERIWDEVVVVYSRYYDGICLEGLSKAKKNIKTKLAGVPAEIRTDPPQRVFESVPATSWRSVTDVFVLSSSVY
jgi:hypothetical protein